jgi:hypothetical protein
MSFLGQNSHLVNIRDLVEMGPWLPAGLPIDGQGGNNEASAQQPLLPCFSEQISLSKIIERMMLSLFSGNSSLDEAGRQACITSLDLDMCHWQESLGDCSKWNKWEPPDAPLMPSVAALQ